MSLQYDCRLACASNCLSRYVLYEISFVVEYDTVSQWDYGRDGWVLSTQPAEPKTMATSLHSSVSTLPRVHAIVGWECQVRHQSSVRR